VQTNNVASLAVVTPADFSGASVLHLTVETTNSGRYDFHRERGRNVEAYAPGSPIFAWSGDDNLTGSSGHDLFVFSQPIGHDTVYNFDTTHDQIDLIGYGRLYDVRRHSGAYCQRWHR